MAFFVRLRHKQAKKMRPVVDQYMATNVCSLYGIGPTNIWTDGRMDIRTDGRTYGQMDGRTDRRVDPLTEMRGCIEKWLKDAVFWLLLTKHVFM